MPFTSTRRPTFPLPYHDRNPYNIYWMWFANVLPPHSLTLRVEYTVPTARKALLQCCNTHLRRETAATTLGLVYVRHSFRLAAIAGYHYNNTVNSFFIQNVELAVLLLAAEEVGIYTQDSSTDGTMHYILDECITEFDA